MDYNLFRKKSLNKLNESSQMNINDYVRNISIRVWLIVISLLIALLTLIVWLFMIDIESTQNFIGIIQNGNIVIFIPRELEKELSDSPEFIIGKDQHNLLFKKSDKVYSIKEVRKEFNYEYFLSKTILSEKNIKVTLFLNNNKIPDNYLFDISLKIKLEKILDYFK